MLESIRKGQRWLTGVLVALVGGVFVFFMGLGQPLQGNAPSQGIVVELGDIRFAYPDFLRLREQHANSYRDQLGDQFSSKVGQSFLDAQALRSLVDRAILAHDAHEMGLRVGKDEIQRVILESPGFRDESGRFDQAGFRDWVEWQYGNEANYIEYTRSTLLGQKMAQLLYAQGDVSEGEARAAALHRLQQVQIAYVALDSETLPPGSETTEDQISAYATDHDNELRAVYQGRLHEFELTAQLRLRHILFELGSDPTPGELKEVQARATAALDRLTGGEAFVDVAAEVSEDLSSRDSGGDLGLVDLDDIAPELAEAAAALAPGEHSEVVRSDRGLHLVLVDERTEAGSRPFAEVRDELAREGAIRQAARERADRLTDELATAIREGKSLEDAARELELPIGRTGMLRRRADGFIVGLGASSDLLAMAFALTTEKPTSPEIFEVGSKLALIQLLDRTEPEPDILTGAIVGERARLAAAKQNGFVQNWIEERRAELTNTGQLKIDSTILEGT
jgi:peptidyl-prolyl cis-trans isomerase D